MNSVEKEEKRIVASAKKFFNSKPNLEFAEAFKDVDLSLVDKSERKEHLFEDDSTCSSDSNSTNISELLKKKVKELELLRKRKNDSKSKIDNEKNKNDS